MARAQDPTEPIRKRASALPGVARGTSCNQSSFKAGKGSFLFVGPGAKGKGFKAMFKLDRSMPQARKLASEEPDRFEVGSTGWVTAITLPKADTGSPAQAASKASAKVSPVA